MKVVVSPNPYRDRQCKLALQACEILNKQGIETTLCLPFDVDKIYDLPTDVRFVPIQDALVGCDIFLCLGGDGTILHASRLVTEHNIPILGINIGTLGFMADMEACDLGMLSQLKDGNYSIEDRMMLEVRVMRDGEVVYNEHCLNDAVVTKGAVARVLQLSVSCNSVEVMSFSGDGVVISTPTGSTAYSLSAGGPVVEPTTRNILITPICAHGQNVNCFVTESSRAISVDISRIGRKSAFLSADGGRAFRLESTDKVLVQRSDRTARLIRLKNRNFFETINKKFFNR